MTKLPSSSKRYKTLHRVTWHGASAILQEISPKATRLEERAVPCAAGASGHRATGAKRPTETTHAPHLSHPAKEEEDCGMGLHAYLYLEGGIHTS